MDHRIRIAVLENDLKHERLAKDAALASSQQIIRSLALAFNTTAAPNDGGSRSYITKSPLQSYEHLQKKVKDLEDDLRASKKETERLRSKIISTFHGKLAAKGRIYKTASAFSRSTFADMRNGKNRAPGSADSHGGVRQFYNDTEVAASRNSLVAETLVKHGNENAEDTGDVTEAMFNSSFTTCDLISDNSPRASDLGAGPTTPENHDIDFLSLEDLIGPEIEVRDQDEKNGGPNVEDNAGRYQISSEILIGDENGFGSEVAPSKKPGLKADQLMLNQPKPAVVRVGVDTTGSFGGADYSLKSRTGTMVGRFERSEDRPAEGSHYHSLMGAHAIISYQQSNAGLEKHALPDFFKYGISYQPSESEQNYLRTVHIGNLPSDITICDLLARVRGGMIVSATLTNTISITGAMSALVVFLNEASATAYAEFMKLHPVYFGSRQAIVTSLTMPTWPINAGLRKAVYEHHHTRSLVIRNFPLGIAKEHLIYDMAGGSRHRADAIVDIYADSDASLHIAFALINAAGSAYGVLTRYRDYRDLDIEFEEDPCARPLEDLLAPAAPQAQIIAVAPENL
ncbi:MAG: hypothetical protein M1818_001271 [Claussenomyces sp. TS43310]|nr:MAG: hypothetical protein M1818_001271 [Claussenomyces sp. TS43310]